MLFITGDTHGQLDKFYTYNMSKNDAVIVTGDFGFIWHGGTKEKLLLDKLSSFPFQIYFIDGNHDNFDNLEDYRIIDFHGGRARQICNNVFHLMRGEVYVIDGKKIFTMGGAASIDKELRVPGQSWWPQEVPNYAEIENGINNLGRHGVKVDYVITHDVPASVNLGFPSDFTRDVLEGFRKELDFKLWYAGHHHMDVLLDDKFQILYNVTLPLGETI